MSLNKIGKKAAIAGMTLVVTAMGLFGGAWRSYATAVGEQVKQGIDAAIPDAVHISACRKELDKARREAAEAFENARQLELDQEQLEEQRTKVRSDKAIYGEKLDRARTLIDQGRTKSDGKIDVTRIYEEAERLMQAREEQARSEVLLDEQIAEIEQLRNDRIATARQTLDEIKRLEIQVKVTTSQSHASQSKQAVTNASEILSQVNTRHDEPVRTKRILQALKSLGHGPSSETSTSEMLNRIDANLAK